MMQYLPRQFIKMREDELLAARNQSVFEMLDSEVMRHLTSQQHEASQVDFLILNYSMASFKAKYRDGMNMDKVRINFAPHAYMFAGCQPGDTRQVNIHAALYTQWSPGSPLEHL